LFFLYPGQRRHAGGDGSLGRAGALTSFLGVSALNYFCVPPRYTFEVDAPEYLLTLGVLLAVSLGNIPNNSVIELGTRVQI
jgi:hypothetical protein